jgi:hypothetical protein
MHNATQPPPEPCPLIPSYCTSCLAAIPQGRSWSSLSLCSIHVLSLVIIILILVRFIIVVSVLQGGNLFVLGWTLTVARDSAPAVVYPNRKQTTLRRSSQKLSCSNRSISGVLIVHAASCLLVVTLLDALARRIAACRRESSDPACTAHPEYPRRTYC